MIHLDITKRKVIDNGTGKEDIREPLRNIMEVAEIFGYTSSKSIWSSIDRGSFPKPDVYIIKHSGGKKAHWKLSTVVAEKKRRDAIKVAEH